MMRLPKPVETDVIHKRRYIGSVYTSEQMRKYAAKAVAKEREACAKHLDDQNTAMTDKLAAEIRARGKA